MNKIINMNIEPELPEELLPEKTYQMDTMIAKDLQSAVTSGDITVQIAIGFVQWYENRDKSIDENMLTWEDYYREFLKTKQ